MREAIHPNKELKLGAITFNGKSADIESYNIDKLKEDTGFIPEVPFEIGIIETVKWLREF